MRLIPFLTRINLQIIILLFLLTGFSARAEQLYVYVKPEYLKIWKNLILQHRPPMEIHVINLAAPDYDGHESFLYISKSSWSNINGEKGNPTKAKKPGGEFFKKTVKTVFYAPAVPFWDKRSDISMKGLHDAHNLEVLPIRQIELPRRALSLDYSYPNNPDYPLKIKYFLILHSNNVKILDWFHSINPIKSNNDEIVWIEAVGDTMLARGIDLSLLKQSGLSFTFGNTLSVLKKCDFLMGNLECVASLKGKRANKRYHFHFNPQALKKLKKAGFSYFSLANNHSLDYGFTGFLDAVNNLKNEGIGISGAGKDLEEASKPFLKSIKGEKIQIFSVGAFPVESSGFDGRNFIAGNETPGILWADKYFMQTLSLKSSRTTFDIVMIHGGREWTSAPTEKQKNLYRKIIDHGADLVVGSHPHYLQGMEVYKHKLIAYSLGNFIFPGMDETQYGEDSIILKAGIYRGNILYLEIYPVLIKGKQIELSKNSRIKNRFIKLTRALK